MQDGSTAVCILRLGRALYAAHAGDSRAVLCREGRAFRLTEDHKPDLQRERDRVAKLSAHSCCCRQGARQGTAGRARESQGKAGRAREGRGSQGKARRARERQGELGKGRESMGKAGKAKE